LWIAVLAVAAGMAAAPAARADYAMIRGVSVSQGQMRIAEEDLDRIRETTPQAADQFVLKETRVEAEISGVLARVRVEHDFQNPYAERLEAVYVFPLPEDAAVDRYWFQVGEQIVRGEVKKREEARYEYEQAKTQGRKAALLEEERPDVFTQSVANIPPQGTITVHLEYVHPVDVDGDRYVFRFPMVVGPRFIPGQPLGQPSVGRGWAPDTDEVPDASRITPTPLPEGMRSGNDVSIRVKLDAGMPIQAVTGVSHELEVQQEPNATEAAIRLKSQTTIADKDFVVEYRLAAESPVVASLAHRGTGGGYFVLVVQPKRETETAELAAREVILLLDTSGSMNGPGISQLRIFAQHVLDGLNPQDTFRVVAFSNSPRVFQAEALAATPENVGRAKEFVRNLQANGGTMMLPALQTALRTNDAEQSRARYLVLVTDALVGNDDSILAWLGRPENADVRVFPVAMGAAPNHYLISRAAEVNRGFATQVTNQDNAAEIAARFNQKVSAPYMTDLEIDWGGLGVKDVLPEVLPDLYADRPLVVMGRYDRPGEAEVRLRGNILGQAVETSLPVTLPEEEPAHDSLAPLWARRQIREIWNRNLGRETAEGRNEITQLELRHQLVTRYTSFVAVEAEAPEQVTGNLLTQDVRPMLPEGMKEESVGVPGRGPSVAQSAPRAPSAVQSAAPAPSVAANAPAAPAANAPSVSAPASYDPAPQDTGYGGSPSGGSQMSTPGGRSGGTSGGSGGGGAVEWLFLASLGALGLGRLGTVARRRRSAD
jgi:Ca-activated chloride channel family protein